ncbi:MAG: GH1 family beta-glucosidase [Terrimesophilobacter sp.]
MTDQWRDVAALAQRMPTGFTVGAATSAFQIEGAVREGGRGRSNWDVFMAQPGRILDHSDAAIAADHFHRVREDVALLADLGVDAYRFSLAWTRLQPTGKGPANRVGVDFYDQLIDELLAAGIRPMATLYHWDTPEPLQHAGGWLNRDTAYRLADYAYLAGEAFGDRIDSWVTVNEPATVTLNGYALGLHAPGATLLFDALPAAHLQLLGHGLAVDALRAAGVTGGIGIVNVHSPVEPASDRRADAVFADLFDVLHNRMYEDPVLLGRYPTLPDGLPGQLRDAFSFLEAIEPSDLDVISRPLDFYGLNYYLPTRIRAGVATSSATPDGHADAIKGLPFSLVDWPEFAATGFGWPIAPGYLSVALRELVERYGDALPPVYITEGGASFPDTVADDGSVDDPRRTAYLADHLAAAFAGVAGVDVRGYFVWSLLDNWEWAAGFTQRFGIVHVDEHTQVRTPKASYRWLQSLLRSR